MNKKEKQAGLQAIADEYTRIFTVPPVSVIYDRSECQRYEWDGFRVGMDLPTIYVWSISALYHELAHHIQFCEWFEDGKVNEETWERHCYLHSPIQYHGFLFCDSLRRILLTGKNHDDLNRVNYPWHTEYAGVCRILGVGRYKK